MVNWWSPWKGLHPAWAASVCRRRYMASVAPAWDYVGVADSVACRHVASGILPAVKSTLGPCAWGPSNGGRSIPLEVILGV